MAIEKLTTAKIAAATKRGYLNDGAGLYLQISKNGSAKSWVFRFRKADGKLREMGLGSLEEVSLSQARKAAAAAKAFRRDYEDPIEIRAAKRLTERLASAKVITFRQCTDRYIAAHSAGWGNPKHRAQWAKTLQDYVYPVFGDLAVAAIDVGLVMTALEPIWTTKPETASRVRGRIESVLDWATARGYRKGENPARWRGHLDELLPKKSKVVRVVHHEALPYEDLPSVMARLRQVEGSGACT